MSGNSFMTKCVSTGLDQPYSSLGLFQHRVDSVTKIKTVYGNNQWHLLTNVTCFLCWPCCVVLTKCFPDSVSLNTFFFLSFAFSCMLVQLFFKKHLCHSYQLWHNCLGRGPYLEVLSTCLLVCLVGWLVADGTLELVVNNWLVVDDWLVGWFDQL